MKQTFKLGGTLAAALLLGTMLGGAVSAQTLTMGVRAGPDFDRSALVDARQPGRSASPRVRHAGDGGRKPADEAGPRGLVEARR